MNYNIFLEERNRNLTAIVLINAIDQVLKLVTPWALALHVSYGTK